MLPILLHPGRLAMTAGILLLCSLEATGSQDSRPPLRRYVCYATPLPLKIDGRLDEPSWSAADWSEPFVDIEGSDRPAPLWLTRVKMLWDDAYLYIGAKLEEPHVWATLTERDAVIYRDNDFEVFIDPDGDTHNYYEVEINALGTVWDLMLLKPYRDRGPAVPAWDIDGLRVETAIDGTLNDPSDIDRSWTVELAIPWSALIEHAPDHRVPRDGELWRFNFSRVQWQLNVVNDGYQKAIDPVTGKPHPEHNWVWSPQGAVNMHMPERWGVVQFSQATVGDGPAPLVPLLDEDVRWALRRLYFAQRAFHREHGRYADDLALLDYVAVMADGTELRPDLLPTAEGFRATARGSAGTEWHIRQDGKIWKDQTGG